MSNPELLSEDEIKELEKRKNNGLLHSEYISIKYALFIKELIKTGQLSEKLRPGEESPSFTDAELQSAIQASIEYDHNRAGIVKGSIKELRDSVIKNLERTGEKHFYDSEFEPTIDCLIQSAMQDGIKYKAAYFPSTRNVSLITTWEETTLDEDMNQNRIVHEQAYMIDLLGTFKYQYEQKDLNKNTHIFLARKEVRANTQSLDEETQQLINQISVISDIIFNQEAPPQSVLSSR